MNHSFHTYLFLVLSLGTKPEFINRQIWTRRLSPNSAQRYFSFLVYWQLLSDSVHFLSLTSFSFLFYPSQASLKKFLDYIQTGAVEKMVKVLDKGLDPNFHDPDTGGEFVTVPCVLALLSPEILFLTLWIFCFQINHFANDDQVVQSIWRWVFTFIFLSVVLPDHLPLWVREPPHCGCAVRPGGGGHQGAGSGRRSFGLQKQRWTDSGAQSCQGSQSHWAVGKDFK